jgi:hypothetical protein
VVSNGTHPMNAKTLMVTTGSGMGRASWATDGTWRATPLLAGQAGRYLAVDGLGPGRGCAGTHGAGLLQSEDGGATWVAYGLSGRMVMAVAASTTQPGRVFAGSKPAGLFGPSDSGQRWDEPPRCGDMHRAVAGARRARKL